MPAAKESLERSLQITFCQEQIGDEVVLSSPADVPIQIFSAASLSDDELAFIVSAYQQHRMLVDKAQHYLSSSEIGSQDLSVESLVFRQHSGLEVQFVNPTDQRILVFFDGLNPTSHEVVDPHDAAWWDHEQQAWIES